MLSEEKKAGILITVAVHLTVIIFLLLTSITVISRRGSTIVIDFQDSPEPKQARTEQILEDQPEELTPEERDAIMASIERLMAQRNIEQRSDYHNVITSRNPDARGTDADKLYEDAARLADALQNGQALTPDDGPDEHPSQGNGSKGKEDGGKPVAYSGASVLSWSLAGRNARQLPVPAYKCMGGGTVTVLIKVNREGRVKWAMVDESTSSKDPCLKKWALAFAQQALFSDSKTAEDPQTGDIIYQFIAQ